MLYRIPPAMFLMFALTICLSSQASAQDKVYPNQGSVASGKITQITRTEVTIEVRGNEQKIPIVDIRKIVLMMNQVGWIARVRCLLKSFILKCLMN